MKTLTIQNFVRPIIHLGYQDHIFVKYGHNGEIPMFDASKLIDDYIKREKIKRITDDYVPVTFYRAVDDTLIEPVNSMYNKGYLYFDLFQSLINSTGHPDRLNRFGLLDSIYSDENYSEELISNLGAMILSLFADTNGVFPIRVDSKDRSIKGNVATFILKAAAKAEKAVEFILQKGGQNA